MPEIIRNAQQQQRPVKQITETRATCTIMGMHGRLYVVKGDVARTEPLPMDIVLQMKRDGQYEHSGDQAILHYGVYTFVFDAKARAIIEEREMSALIIRAFDSIKADHIKD